jgi:hypothetical protein
MVMGKGKKSPIHSALHTRYEIIVILHKKQLAYSPSSYTSLFVFHRTRMTPSQIVLNSMHVTTVMHAPPHSTLPLKDVLTYN